MLKVIVQMHGTRKIRGPSTTNSRSDTAEEAIKKGSADENMSLPVTPDQKSGGRSWQTRSRIGKCCKICEVVMLILAMLIIIGFFLIPTAYYVLAVAVSLVVWQEVSYSSYKVMYYTHLECT